MTEAVAVVTPAAEVIPIESVGRVSPNTKLKARQHELRDKAELIYLNNSVFWIRSSILTPGKSLVLIKREKYA